MRTPRGNRLLDALPHKERQRFLKNCVLVDLALGETLAKPHEPIRHVYFPIESYISIVTEMGESRGLEVALVGKEGALGASLALGVRVSPFLAVVQGAGPAYRMRATQFSAALGNGNALRQVIQSYVFVQMSQLGQIAGCARFHLLEQRLARWLSMTADRAQSKTFQVTHSLLSHLLGVRRVGITTAATSLQKRKLIAYRRGNVEILDRNGLEQASCGCYETDLAIYDRILG